MVPGKFPQRSLGPLFSIINKLKYSALIVKIGKNMKKSIIFPGLMGFIINATAQIYRFNSPSALEDYFVKPGNKPHNRK